MKSHLPKTICRPVKLGMELISREVVESVAKIIGEHSAAKQALNDADSHPGPVVFYKVGNTFIVEKL